MVYFKMSFCLCTLFIMQYFGSNMTADPLYLHSCYGGNYTSNSSFRTNLNLLLPSLSSANTTIIKNGYFNATQGRNPDTVYGSFQCSGDISSEADCQSCVGRATKKIQVRCPNSKQAIIWYQDCMLRYSSEPYFSVIQYVPLQYVWNENKVTDREQFNRLLDSLMNELIPAAVSNNGSSSFLSKHNFAAGELTFNSEKRYGFVQCTSDLSAIRKIVLELPKSGKVGGRIICPSCRIRYEMNPFFAYEMTAPPPSSEVLQPPPYVPSNNGRKIMILIVACSSAFTILSTIVISLCLYRRKTKKHNEDTSEIQSSESLQFHFSTIEAATSNFSEATKLGEGGFGSVYKGTLLDGQEIAVKRLSRYSGQGNEEFKNEVAVVAKLQHRNLVRLLGFCLHGEERLLVYEFMPNGSLDQSVFDPLTRANLDWETRYKIIGGIARGLLYLHEDSRLRIVHRDLKASNVLLEADMNPKISDFGMAKIMMVDQTQATTDRIMGTYGYMAPEYAMRGYFSLKSDVFSFGVLVLEILSGLRNNSFDGSEDAPDLLSYAWMHWNEGTYLDFLDPTLGDTHCSGEVVRCVHIGLLCVQANITDRPTMASIINSLNNYSATLPLLSKPPPFFVDSRENTVQPHGNEIDEVWTVNEASISVLHPR